MGLTSAMVTGLSGLTANQGKIDVIGNNISNVNTLGFKSSRLDFKTQFSITSGSGSPPDGALGGTNPIQVGMGTVEASVSRNFNDGSREVTGVNSHMAIEGDGFFILQGGSRVYSRDGSFKLNATHDLVSADGLYVQGYGIDQNFNIIPGVLTNLNIPLGDLTVAKATEDVDYSGNLNTDGAIASSASRQTTALSSAFYTSGGVVTSASAGTTLLTSVLAGSTTGTPMFPANSEISVAVLKGNRTTAEKKLTVTASTTVQDYLNFMQGSLGIENTTTDPNVNQGFTPNPGVTLNADGTITVVGNLGADNDFNFKNASIKVTNGASATNPFLWQDKAASATGESVFTSTNVYDSLGSACTLDMTLTLVSKSDTGTVWRYYASSPSGTPSGALTDTALGTGTLSFDTNGKLLGTPSVSISIDRSNTGATPQLTFNLDFSAARALAGTKSSLACVYQNGSEQGTLQDYSVGENGVISGSFSNGLVRTIGQVALATFRNNGGLVDVGNNAWVEGPNSGSAVISAPGEFTAGKIVANSLELSNVDLSAEFINMITASTGFSAASRVITTANQLMQELLQAAR